jgi:phage gp36-like protein
MAYIYAAKADIFTYHDSRLITQLTHDNDEVDVTNPENVDETLLQAVENAASTMIDNYLRYVYTDLPLTGGNLTQEIKQMAANLTWCLLWERRGEEPEQVTQLRERIMKRLDEMSDPDAKEVRGPRSTEAYATRSSLGRAQTVFDDSGYFDHINSIRGRRRLAGDLETEQQR